MARDTRNGVVLSPPVPMALCATAREVPAPTGCAGGCAFEAKLDGFRGLVFVGDAPERMVIQSRNGKNLCRFFPDLAVALTGRLPAGTVVDGEIIRVTETGTDFRSLQARLIARSGRLEALAASAPASFAAFDLLAVPGRDLRREPYRLRREMLTDLLAEAPPPLQLVPATGDRDQALGWMRDWASAGVEGLVVKGLDEAYPGGQRRWIKIRRAVTVEAIVGGITGSLAAPDTLILGVWDTRGRLRIAGRTRPVPRALRPELAAVLTAAEESHPWPELLPRSRLGQLAGAGPAIAYTRVAPQIVVEVRVDSPLDDRFQGVGQWS